MRLVFRLLRSLGSALGPNGLALFFFLLLVGIAYEGIYNRLHPRIDVKTVHDGSVQLKLVDVPVVTEKVVTKTITDPTARLAADRLLKENEDLKKKVTQLSISLANSVTTGGVELGGIVAQVPTADGTVYEYRDYQLDAKYTTKDFGYTLTQSFIVVNTVNVDKDGNRSGLTGLFQKTPSGLVNIPVETTNIITDSQIPHWFVSPRIQGGIGYDNGTGAIIGLQWFKRGKSKANEDIPVAILTPSIFLSKERKELDVLPISFNVGSTKHVPLTNIWVSPFLGKQTLGVALSATF